jgi:hypothetical protein
MQAGNCVAGIIHASVIKNWKSRKVKLKNQTCPSLIPNSPTIQLAEKFVETEIPGELHLNPISALENSGSGIITPARFSTSND